MEKIDKDVALKKDAKTTKKQAEKSVKNVIDINPQLVEALNDSVVVGWGRMNPITTGHEKLVNKVIEVAKRLKATPKIYLTQTSDPKKNPLQYSDKISLAKKAFGPIIVKSKAKTIIEVMKELQTKFKKVFLVVGSDRVGEFNTLLQKYNGKDYTFDSIEIVSAGERDPDAEDVTGMSASKMRKYAQDNNLGEFKKGLPTKLQSIAQDVFDMVRDGMNLAEELEAEGLLYETVLTQQQRRKRALIMRKYKTKIAQARKRALRRAATTDKLKIRARKKAINIIRQKVAGKQGLNYAELSPGEKMIIDKRVEKRKMAIDRIAKRLVPQVRKADLLRLSGRKMNEDFDSMFEQHLDEAKKFHHMFTKEGKIKLDKRFRAFRHVKEGAIVDRVVDQQKNEREGLMKKHRQDRADARVREIKMNLAKANEETKYVDFETEEEVIGFIDALSEELFTSIAVSEQKEFKALKEKAEKYNIAYEVVEQVYTQALSTWTEDSKLTPQQLAFDKVNHYLNEKIAHALDPKKTLKHGMKDAVAAVDRDMDGDVDALDKPGVATPDEITGAEKQNITKKYMINRMKEKQHTRKGVAYEDVNEAFEACLDEGVNDPGIFKAVFLAGGPGSGKSFIVGQTALTTFGLKLINSDNAFEALLDKVGLKPTPEDIFSDKGQEVRGRAKALTAKMQKLALDGRLGLVIDGTGKDYLKIATQSAQLRQLGYDTAMIFVNTDLETAQARNAARTRTLPADEVEKMWKGVQNNIGKFQNTFGRNMFIVDNSDGANWQGGVNSVYKRIGQWVKEPHKNPNAIKWIAAAKKERGIKEDIIPGYLANPVKKIMFAKKYSQASSVLKDILARKRNQAKDEKRSMRHSPEYYASEIIRTTGSYGQLDPKILAKMATEESGAGDEGTSKVTKRYKKDTPYQNVKEDVSQKEIKDLEIFADRLLNKFNIDIEFTRHFVDRVNDDRNNPEIKVSELQQFFKKIALEKGNNIKRNPNAEVVLKDVQKDLNLPVVINYDKTKDEFEVVNKTIMRKKAFTTPNKVIKY